MSSVSVEEALLVLKIAFLVLLYLFIWRIVASASRDIRAPQESFIVAPGVAAPRPAARPRGRLVVVRSPTLPPGKSVPLDSAAVTIGRSPGNDFELRGDGFASARHAVVEPRPDAVWVSDHNSTNGTFVNGTRIDGARRLKPGDVVRVGETDLRYEA